MYKLVTITFCVSLFIALNIQVNRLNENVGDLVNIINEINQDKTKYYKIEDFKIKVVENTKNDGKIYDNNRIPMSNYIEVDGEDNNNYKIKESKFIREVLNRDKKNTGLGGQIFPYQMDYSKNISKYIDRESVRINGMDMSNIDDIPIKNLVNQLYFHHMGKVLPILEKTESLCRKYNLLSFNEGYIRENRENKENLINGVLKDNIVDILTNKIDIINDFPHEFLIYGDEMSNRLDVLIYKLITYKLKIDKVLRKELEGININDILPMASHGEEYIHG